MSDFESVLQAEVDAREAAARAATAAKAEAREQERDRFEEARHAGLVLLEEVCRPLVDDFQRVMEAKKILRDGRTRRDFPAASRAEAGCVHLVFRALGAVRARRYYEIRLTAEVAGGDCGGSSDVPGRGILKLSAECVTYLPPDSRRVAPAGPVQSLVPPDGRSELPNGLPNGLRSETVSATFADPAAQATTRTWCQEILKRSAAAVIDAARAFAQPAVAPPLCAPLAAAPVFGEAMSFEL